MEEKNLDEWYLICQSLCLGAVTMEELFIYFKVEFRKGLIPIALSSLCNVNILWRKRDRSGKGELFSFHKHYLYVVPTQTRQVDLVLRDPSSSLLLENQLVSDLDFSNICMNRK